MSYIKSNLLEGERIIYKPKLHPISYMLPAVIVCIGIALRLVTDNRLITISILFIGVCLSFRACFTYGCSEFALTNMRIITTTGFFQKRFTEIPLNKIELFQYRINWLGSIMDYGSIVICGTGGLREYYTLLASPLLFINKAQKEIGKVNERSPKKEPETKTDSIPANIADLNQVSASE